MAAAAVSAEEFAALFARVRTWGRWGSDDERGALNHLGAEEIRLAAALVRDGRSVSLSLPLDTTPGVHNPAPAVHYMTPESGADIGSGSLHFLKDFVGADYHNDGHTHLDALCHVAYEGRLYNGRPEDAVAFDGASVESVEVLRDGLVGRGVLLDIPRLRGVPWLEPGDSVTAGELEAAERAQGVTVQRGDILLVNLGHARRLRELGPWDAASHKAGLHPTAMSFVAEREVAVLGSDGNSDTAPSDVEGVDFPVHVLALNAMGVHLLDYLRFEGLCAACERDGRWSFLFMAAPLRIVNGTGSPLNPIALF
jgi:kynurenine formamidase